MANIKKGDKIKVEYVGKLEDGTIFDSTEKHGKPLEFEVGSGQLIKGFDNAVIGMNIGEEKEVEIPPEDAYGHSDPELIKEMPRQSFPDNQTIEPGMIFMISLQDGRQIPVKISNVKDEIITIDLNPPLVGKTLFFKIKIVSIEN